MSALRILFIFLGTITLILGIVGVFLPLLPTTPFLLLTAFFYFKGSPRCYEWLLRQPVLGKYIRDFRENKVIPLHAKIVSIAMLWGCMLYCIVSVLHNWPLRILLLLIATGTTIHILSFKSK